MAGQRKSKEQRNDRVPFEVLDKMKAAKRREMEAFKVVEAFKVESLTHNLQQVVRNAYAAYATRKHHRLA